MSVYEKGSLIFQVAACRHFKPCLWRLRIRAQYLIESCRVARTYVSIFDWLESC